MIKGKVGYKPISFVCVGDFSSVDHCYVAYRLKFTTGPFAGYNYPIIAYNGTTKVVTLNAQNIPNIDDEFIIER